MTGIFGRAMDRSLRTLPNASVTTYGSCSSRPSWWFNSTVTTCGFLEHHPEGELRSTYPSNRATPHLPSLLQQLRPDTVVVALGANLIEVRPERVEQTTRHMAQRIVDAGARCIWIGPPHGRNKPEPMLSGLYEGIRKGVEPLCTLIDSRPLAQYPPTGGDGKHYDSLGAPGRVIAFNWAMQVSEQIRSIW